jgi:hypothetical protein
MAEHSAITVGVILDLEEPDPHDPPAVLRVGGQLFIETDHGIRHLADGGGLGVVFGDGQEATRRELEEATNHMLGRGETRPPHLAWEQLRGVLDREGIAVTDEELIAMPLVLELSSELLEKLDR